MITINGLTAASMRLVIPWSGVWVAELELLSDVVPSGPASIVSTDGLVLVGKIDAKRSGSFAEKRFARVLGGGGGWGSNVLPQHYHSDIGVRLDEVVATTAVAAGELAIVLAPKVLGIDFLRAAGPAAQVFAAANVDWWVGLDGVTRVGRRIPIPAPPTLLVVDWDAAHEVVTFASEIMPEPGMILVDARFGAAPRIVREVEALAKGASFEGSLRVAPAAADAGASLELVDLLGTLARDATEATFGRLHEYVVVAMAGDRVSLAPVDLALPPLRDVSIWAGVSGTKAMLRPGSRVLVGFRGGERTKPFVAAYEPPESGSWRPVRLELDALAELVIGALAPSIKIGAGAVRGAARMGDAVIAGPFGGTITTGSTIVRIGG